VLRNYTNSAIHNTSDKQSMNNTNIGENADSENNNNNIRTPLSGMNLGVVELPKINIKKVNETTRA
jgi:hypothetical protein